MNDKLKAEEIQLRSINSYNKKGTIIKREWMVVHTVDGLTFLVFDEIIITDFKNNPSDPQWYEPQTWNICKN